MNEITPKSSCPHYSLRQNCRATFWHSLLPLKGRRTNSSEGPKQEPIWADRRWWEELNCNGWAILVNGVLQSIFVKWRGILFELWEWNCINWQYFHRQFIGLLWTNTKETPFQVLFSLFFSIREFLYIQGSDFLGRRLITMTRLIYIISD